MFKGQHMSKVIGVHIDALNASAVSVSLDGQAYM